jgi:hypothetical protein
MTTFDHLVRNELERIIDSESFRNARRLRAFLRFIVEETLAGRSADIKEYAIGVAVCGRPESFDPKVDPIVRVDATRLRSRLELYYQTAVAPPNFLDHDRLTATAIDAPLVIGAEAGLLVDESRKTVTTFKIVMSCSMRWKRVGARSTKINRTVPRHDLEHYCRNLNGWPRSWMGLEKDLPHGPTSDNHLAPIPRKSGGLGSAAKDDSETRL